jgi:hypothetical protein
MNEPSGIQRRAALTGGKRSAATQRRRAVSGVRHPGLREEPVIGSEDSKRRDAPDRERDDLLEEEAVRAPSCLSRRDRRGAVDHDAAEEGESHERREEHSV